MARGTPENGQNVTGATPNRSRDVQKRPKRYRGHAKSPTGRSKTQKTLQGQRQIVRGTPENTQNVTGATPNRTRHSRKRLKRYRGHAKSPTGRPNTPKTFQGQRQIVRGPLYYFKTFGWLSSEVALSDTPSVESMREAFRQSAR